jgi:hypothetical protein
MKNSLFFSLSFIGNVGAATALPLVLFAFLGRWLDQKYNTGHTLLIVGIVIAAFLSFMMLRKITKKAIEDIKKIK